MIRWCYSFMVFAVSILLVKADSSLKIIAGINASQGEFPYAVSLRYNNCHECGGSIIHKRWVLTAAHCIFPNAVNLSTILYGTVNAENCKYAPNNTIKVKRAVVHQDFDLVGGQHCNDIALVEVKEPFKFDHLVGPVHLPYPYKHPPDLELSTLLGWGYEKTNGTVPPVLKKVDIDIFPDSVCSSFFHENYTSFCHVCAGAVGGGRGQCTGDSGGPLVHNNVQIGVVSWSNKPCATTPGVLVRVSSYIHWIRKVTGIFDL